MRTVCCTLLLCSILCSNMLLAQTDAFPLALGNRWVYENDEGDRLTRNIVSVQTINGTDFFTRVDSVLADDGVWSIDTIILFDSPDNPNDVMAIADELPVDTMKIRQHEYYGNPHGGSQEWSELYVTENGPFDSVRVIAGHAYLGASEVPQIGLDGIFEFSLMVVRYQQDTIVEYPEEYSGCDYPATGHTIFSYYPGDLTVCHEYSYFDLVAYELQTVTGMDSWTLPSTLKVYPNPAVNEIFIDFSETTQEDAGSWYHGCFG